MAEYSARLLRAEYAEVEQALSDPAVHGDQAKARKLGRRFAELAPVLAVADELESCRDDLGTARELAGEDASFAAEAVALAARIDVLEARAARLLLPRMDGRGQGRHPRGQGRRGWRRVRVVRW